ncbi:rCG23592, partial [Rattus norvegicus]
MTYGSLAQAHTHQPGATRGPGRKPSKDHLAVTLRLELFSRRHQIIYLGKSNGEGGREGRRYTQRYGVGQSQDRSPWMETWHFSRFPSSLAGRWDSALLTLQSWNAGTGDGRKTGLGPLEDR